MSANLFQQLIQIVNDPASEGIVLGGGFGMLLKREYQRKLEIKTLLELPGVRATQDLDIFLPIEIFVNADRASAFRDLLEKLGYDVYLPNYQFGMDDAEAQRLKIDLLARSPVSEEKVRFDRVRVGKDSNLPIHGRTTPEAFAIDDSPIPVSIDGNSVVLVPHPYAWLNMKIEAAYDWLREEKGEIKMKLVGEQRIRVRQKHVYDVYALAAMLTEKELKECENTTLKYREHSKSAEIREKAVEMFSDPNGIATANAEVFARTSFGDPGFKIDHAVFFDGLKQSMGL